MTVEKLINILSKLPKNLKVVVSNGEDYPDIDEARGIVIGYHNSNKKCSGTFVDEEILKIFDPNEKANAVRIF